MLELLIQAAVDLLPDREKHLANSLKSQLKAVLKDSGQSDPQRIAQELAGLAVATPKIQFPTFCSRRRSDKPFFSIPRVEKDN